MNTNTKLLENGKRNSQVYICIAKRKSYEHITSKRYQLCVVNHFLVNPNKDLMALMALSFLAYSVSAKTELCSKRRPTTQRPIQFISDDWNLVVTDGRVTLLYQITH